jgi:hypothetical protein
MTAAASQTAGRIRTSRCAAGISSRRTDAKATLGNTWESRPARSAPDCALNGAQPTPCSQPLSRADRPSLDSGQSHDSPAGFLRSCSGHRQQPCKSIRRTFRAQPCTISTTFFLQVGRVAYRPREHEPVPDTAREGPGTLVLKTASVASRPPKSAIEFGAGRSDQDRPEKPSQEFCCASVLQSASRIFSFKSESRP